jgi:outer membrane immunogenic protein
MMRGESMKRDVLRGLGLLALAFAAQPVAAADLPVKAPVVRAPASVIYNWTGCYIGAQVGGLWGKTRHDITPTVAAYELDVDFSGVTAGGHAGCNYQVQQFVFGVEGDLSWANADDQTQIVPFNQFYRTTFDWYATIRGRAGFAFDRWHIYGTGGFAFADINISWSGQPGNFLYTTASKHGWVAGGGIEHAFAPNWIGRIEYLYHRFEEGSFISDGGDFRFDMRPSFHVVRAGLSYKFTTGATPVMARY